MWGDFVARICPLFSGSSGNSTYISTSAGSLLVDTGASCKRLEAAITAAGGNISDILAVAVTHEHIDHINGLKVFLKKSGATLVASTKTLEALTREDRIPADTNIICADSGQVAVGDIILSRFATSHDCAGSSGYTVSVGDKKIAAVCTDLGIVTDEVREALDGFPAVLIESNHDVEMLRRGPYPPHLKLRILSESGHLSNNACAAELPRLLKGGTSRFILGHLSRNNNLPMLALSSARATLSDIGATADRDYIITVAKPECNGVIPL